MLTVVLCSNTGTFVLVDPSEAARLAEDQVIAVQAMRNSRITLPFELLDVRVLCLWLCGSNSLIASQRITKWETKLLRVSDILDEWMRCQHLYTQLQPVFAHDEIVNKLAQEARKYVFLRQCISCG